MGIAGAEKNYLHAFRDQALIPAEFCIASYNLISDSARMALARLGELSFALSAAHSCSMNSQSISLYRGPMAAVGPIGSISLCHFFRPFLRIVLSKVLFGIGQRIRRLIEVSLPWRCP